MSKKIKAFKFSLFIIVVIILIVLTIHLFPIMKDLSTIEGQIEFKNRVSNIGPMGYLVLFGLQFAQMFLAILPGEPIEVLAGMYYGTFGGLIFIFVSVFIISTIIFFAVKKYGKKFVYGFCSKEKIEKIENSKLFQNPKKIEWIMLILFLMPGTPKDLLIYIAGLLPVKPLRFILISTFARFPSVISSTLVGSSLLKGNWKFSISIYVVTFIIVALIIFIINKFDKDKTVEHVVKNIK